MGISKKSAFFLLKNKTIFKSKVVLSLGNPFIENKFDRKYLTSKEQLLMSSRSRDLRAKCFFIELLQARSFQILDIVPDEGADLIADLNFKLGKDLKNKFDVILDFGTQEHIFNTTEFYKNINYLLKENGFYFFDLPANNYLEHGFRQYSPTNFYDLCSSNNSLFKICYLTLWTEKLSLNVLPLYKKLDKDFLLSVDLKKVVNPIKDINLGKLTGLCISLLSKSKKPTGVLGVINKKSCEDINFSIIQCMYKNYSLAEVIAKKPNIFSTKKLLIILKEIIVNYLPPIFTIKFLNLIFKIKIFEKLISK